MSCESNDTMSTDDAGTPREPGRSVGRTGDRTTDRQLALVALAGVMLVVLGTAMASWTATAGGDVRIEERTFETESGNDLAATVYAPADASAGDPAPAVVLVHGYSGVRGTMNSFAVEFARRGYVAVTVDATGHGESAGTVGDDGYGGPAALEAVRSMDAVDEDRVAVAGHSMGGFASLAAASEHPEGYAAVVLVSSSWEADDEVDAWTPRNVAVVFGRYDELAARWWDQPAPGGAAHSEKLADAFGTDPPVERGRTYGDVEAGTGRRLTAPGTIHIGMHRSPAAVGDTVEWVVLATDGPAEPGPDRQRWHWMFLGHVLALAGGLLVAVATTVLTWRRLDRADATREEADLPAEERDLPVGTAVALSALPALTVYPLYAVGTAVVPVTAVTPQQPTHGTVLWALGTALLGAGVVRWRLGGVDRTALERLAPDGIGARRAIGAAAAGVAALHAVAALVAAVPGGAMRAWVVGVAPLTPVRLVTAALYAAPLVAATVALSAGLGRVLGRSSTLGRDVGRALAVACGGLLVFLAAQYVPLLLGFGLPLPVGLLSSVAIFVTAYVALATVVATTCERLTGSVWPGGLLAGLLVTWVVAGSGPMHAVPF
jgi:pimeloyl-ACP methyl ester carboxylesterase